MASVTSPRRTHLSASDSTKSTPHSPKNENHVIEGASNNGVFHADENKPHFDDNLDHLDSTQCIERFKKYDAEYSRRLLAKYFSSKSLLGGNIFDEQITVGDQTIKSSRLPCLRSCADPVVGFEDRSSNGTSSPADTGDTQGSIPNGKHMAKKN